MSQRQPTFYAWLSLATSIVTIFLKFAAYYYNRAAQWGREVVIQYKYNAFAGHPWMYYDIDLPVPRRPV